MLWQTDLGCFHLKPFEHDDMFGEVALYSKYTNFHILVVGMQCIYCIPTNHLPAASRDLLRLRHLRDIASDHWLAEVLAHFRQNACILIMCHSLDNGSRAFGRIA